MPRGRVLVRIVVSVVVIAIAVTARPPVALAGGSWFTPVQDRSEPGDLVTLVGYTGGGQQGWISDGPFYGYLVAADGDGATVGAERLPLGVITLTETGRGGYLALRASITFRVPADLAVGRYSFDHCNATCDKRLGDLVGGLVNVGIAPAFPVSREWPVDDPEFANLADDARLVGPDFTVTAGEIRRGAIVGHRSAEALAPPAATATIPTSVIGVVDERPAPGPDGSPMPDPAASDPAASDPAASDPAASDRTAHSGAPVGALLVSGGLLALIGLLFRDPA